VRVVNHFFFYCPFFPFVYGVQNKTRKRSGKEEIHQKNFGVSFFNNQKSRVTNFINEGKRVLLQRKRVTSHIYIYIYKIYIYGAILTFLRENFKRKEF
jgi:hypothetical protein